MKNLIALGDLPNEIPAVFPTFHAAKWFHRKHGAELLAEGVTRKINRRVLFDLDRLEAFIAERREV